MESEMNEIHPKMYLYKRIVKAKLFIDEHYSEKINLYSISRKASFSRFHFLRLFKSSFGKSPHKYLTEVRITNAKKLLETNKSISEVCFLVGFESIPSFTKLFKKHHGLSPKQYVKKVQQSKIREMQSPLSFVPSCFAETYRWKN